MFRLTRVLDWFCLDEREKNAHGARSGVNALNHRALKLLIPDRLSSIVFPVLSSLFLKRCQLSRSRSPEKKKPANKLVESAHHLTLTETWEFQFNRVVRRGDY